jgi:hypothetical protein
MLHLNREGGLLALDVMQSSVTKFSTFTFHYPDVIRSLYSVTKFSSFTFHYPPSFTILIWAANIFAPLCHQLLLADIEEEEEVKGEGPKRP